MLNNYLYIIPSNNKNKIIENVRNNNKLTNIKFMTFNEFINNYYFSYKEDAIIYIINKYKVNYNIAKIYLDNIYNIININDKIDFNNKIKFLIDLKKDLEDNNYIIYNKLFNEYLKKVKVKVYNFDYLTKKELNIINEIKNITEVQIVNELNNKNTNKKNIYQLNNIDEEIDYVANKIIELIYENVNINNIKLILPKEYYLSVERIFNIYNIPIIFNTKNLYNTFIGSNLLNNLDNIDKYLESINDQKILKKIVNILNKYSNYDYVKISEVIKEELKRTSLKEELDNYIEIINLDHYNDYNDKYIFLLGFNQSFIPLTYKDEDYLEDKLKKELNIDTSYELNTLIRKFTIDKINYINNLIITYSNSSFISSLNNELNYNIIKINNNIFNYSNKMNRLKLSIMLDNYYKYGTIHENQDYLYSNYKDLLYKKYNNKYNKINNNLLKEYLNNKLLLSYSSIDNYMKCKFKYYLNNILKIRKKENTFSLFIGNLFHYILSICFKEDFDFEYEYNKYINDYSEKLNEKEKYFINNLKKELINIVEVVKKQHNDLLYKDTLLEEKIYINYDNKEIDVSFMGIIDKVIYKEENGLKKIAIIDYKTGNVNLNLDNLIYGINMQLPIYIYLAKRSNKLKNSIIIGFYLQKILSDDLKLFGYTLDSEYELENFEPGYKNSSIIKGMKMTSNGFSTYAKTFNDEKINEIDSTINNIIDNSIVDILESDFAINPKIIDNENVSCTFCKYKDICFMKEEDIIRIKKDHKNN